MAGYSEFIKIQSVTTSGALGSLPRAVVLCTRETVTGYTADSETGLYKILSTDLETFEAANSDQYGLINALRTIFNQVYAYEFVYILSTGGTGTALTEAMLNKANKRPRDWSFATIVSQYQGGGAGAPVDEATKYFADLGVLAGWATDPKGKIIVHTYSKEDNGGTLSLPTELALGSTIGSNNNVKTIVSNSQHEMTDDPSAPVAYDNIALAWLSYNIAGLYLSRSWGSLSDAHDFEYVSADTYTTASRSVIENAALGQYNGAKDRGGSVFVYDTTMNDSQNPPLSLQIESLAAKYYIEDYVYVYVRNTLQAAGQSGVPNDDGGIQLVSNLVQKALRDCWSNNLILSKDNGSPDFSVATKTAAEVTTLSANWQTTGIWPAGVISATVKLFGAAHYVVINFAFT